MERKLTAYLLTALICMTCLCSCAQETGGEYSVNKGKRYSDMLKYIQSIGDTQLTEISRVRIMSTNGSKEAVAGSAVTYWAQVGGKSASGGYITEKYTQVTVSRPQNESDYVFLRESTIAFIDDDNEKHVEISVSFSSESKVFSYDVVQQDVSADNIAILANTLTGTGENFEPKDLSVSGSIYYTHGADGSVSRLADVATKALEEMFEGAAADGIILWGCSGYRPYSMQKSLYDAAVASLGEDQNDTAKPGFSEHQTGLTMDITWSAAGGGLYEAMENDSEYAWLIENSWKYGWVLRYPKDSEDITGYIFEPWHYRYIGRELAAEYHKSGMNTLDEFLSVPRYK